MESNCASASDPSDFHSADVRHERWQCGFESGAKGGELQVIQMREDLDGPAGR